MCCLGNMAFAFDCIPMKFFYLTPLPPQKQKKPPESKNSLDGCFSYFLPSGITFGLGTWHISLNCACIVNSLSVIIYQWFNATEVWCDLMCVWPLSKEVFDVKESMHEENDGINYRSDFFSVKRSSLWE